MLLPVYFNCTLVQFCLGFNSSTGNLTAHARHATSTEPEDVTTVSRHSVPDGAGVLGEVWAGVADGDGSVRGDGVRRQNQRVRLESQHQELARERLRRLHLRCLQLTRSRNTNDDTEAYVTSHALLWAASELHILFLSVQVWMNVSLQERFQQLNLFTSQTNQCDQPNDRRKAETLPTKSNTTTTTSATMMTTVENFQK